MGKCTQCGAIIENGKCSYCGVEYEQAVLNDVMPNEQVETQEIVYKNQNNINNGKNPDLASPKSKILALILAIFLGYFGAHQFYAGKIGMGILYVLTVGIFGIGWIIDIISIARGRFKDSEGLLLK